MPSINPKEIAQRLGTIKGELKPRGPKNTLSVCMIVKNEESNIEAAIRSFLPFADEIIVNDTGSTDATLEILKRLPVKVIQNPWEGDFSKARNQSLDAATCTWILWMDADDRVPASQVSAFQRLKTAPLDRCFGFQVVNTQSGHAIGTRFMQTRMFPNHPKIRFERRVHEQVIYSIAAMGLYSFFIETEIHHTGYEDPVLKKKKAERNIELLLNDPDRDVDPILAMQEGDSYAILEQWEKSIESYKHAYYLPDCEKLQRDAWMEIPNCIGRSYKFLGDYRQAEEWFLKALDHNKNRIEPYFYLGELFFLAGDYAKSIPYLEKAVSLDRVLTSVANQYDVMSIYSFNYLSTIYSKEKKFAEGCRVAKNWVEKWPDVIEGNVFYAKFLLSDGKPDLAAKYFQKSIEMSGERDSSVWNGFFFALENSGASPEIIKVWKEKSPFHKVEEKPHLAGDLSVCMIVKNEEKNLGKCLASLQSLNAELIVVDTGSTDKTRTIAQSYGAQLFDFAWCDDFSKARNFSFSKASGRWILWLDADDCILPEDALRIQQIVKEEALCAYGLNVKNSTDGGNTGSVFQQIRLVPNKKEVHFSGRVHEQLSPALQAAGIPIKFVNVKVLHTGYVDDEVVAQKQKRNLAIMLQEIKEEPEKITAVKYYSIGGCYQDLGEYQSARKYYQKALERGQSVGEDPHIVEMSPVKMAQCFGNEEKYDQAMVLVQESLRQFPFNPELIQLAAQLYQRLGNLDKAMQYYMSILVFEEEGHVIPFDFQTLKFKSLRFLADYLPPKGQIELAKLLLREGLKLKNGQELSRELVFNLCFEYEAYALCEALLSFVIQYRPTISDFYELGRTYIMMNDPKKSLEILEKGNLKYPGNPDLLNLLRLLQKDLGIVQRV